MSDIQLHHGNQFPKNQRTSLLAYLGAQHSVYVYDSKKKRTYYLKIKYIS